MQTAGTEAFGGMRPKVGELYAIAPEPEKISVLADLQVFIKKNRENMGSPLCQIFIFNFSPIAKVATVLIYMCFLFNHKTMNMKRMILSAGLLVMVGGIASAQTAQHGSSNAISNSSPTKTENLKKKKGKKVHYSQLNQRKTYKWKTGQRATPTGQEATPLGGGYASLRKDTSTVVVPPARRDD